MKTLLPSNVRPPSTSTRPPLFDDHLDDATRGIARPWCILLPHVSIGRSPSLLILNHRGISPSNSQPSLMPVATSPSALLPTSPVVKMEDRKRPAINTEEIAPPSKRQQVNGSSKARDNTVDMGDEAWIEVSNTTCFQSDSPPPPLPFLTSPSYLTSHPTSPLCIFFPREQAAQAWFGEILVSRHARRRETLLTRSVLMRGLLSSACRAARSTNAPQPFAGILLHPILNGRYTPPISSIEFLADHTR